MLSLPIQQLLFNNTSLKCVFNGVASNAADATTYTFSAQNIGYPHSNRLVVVSYHAEDAATSYSLSTVTITPTGGTTITATQATGTLNTPAIKAGSYFATVPVGWDASIDLTFSEAITSCSIAVYCIYGITRYKNIRVGAISPVFDSVPNQNNDNTAMPLSQPGPCVVIAQATNAASGDRCTWTGIDEMYDQDVSTENGITGGFRVYGGGGLESVTADFVTGTSIGASSAVFY